LNTVAAKYTSTAGGSIGTGSTLQNFESKEFDTHGAFSSGIYTVPETGYYQVNTGLATASVTLSTAQAASCQLFVNGSLVGIMTTRGNGASNQYGVQISDVFRLKKGDTVSVYANSTVATSQTTSVGYNFFSIAKTNISSGN
jgi:hypothetical protein